MATSSFLFFIIIITSFTVTPSSAKLTENFYEESCPRVQQVVYESVSKAIKLDPGVGAGLIRLLFHDCFVRGCDASVLLDSTDGKPSEKESLPNKNSLRGFEAIDDAKKAVEDVCPGTVSCADLLAFASRDAAMLMGGIKFNVPGGRRDDFHSREDEPVKFLPSPFADVSSLEDMFAKKGLSVKDTVVLSGAHSLGVAHCSNFRPRLYNKNNSIVIDPTLNPSLASVLTDICPANISNNNDPTVPLDFVSSHRLDNVYYKNIRKHRVVLVSDQVLDEDEHTEKMVKYYAKHSGAWKEEFAKAMVKMSKIEVLVGDEGEIRRNCRVVNKDA
ncbi:hypothetical protein RND81_04G194400 [Saponaria officinalis]|uniref:Peroxidase n=1 Tax=Saponaria officinalis TaxID=3572 RepID=A0AAW1LG20_SAPOF